MTTQPPASRSVTLFGRVLCAIDGSRGSAEAVRAAIALCRPRGTVHFVAVTDVRGVGLNRMASVGEYRAGQVLAAARALARDRGVGTETELVHDGDVAGALLSRAHDHDLLVLGSHRETRMEGIVVGSVATTVTHRAGVPVLVARPAPHGAGPFPSRILVATALEHDADRLVETAGALAVAHDAHVQVVHALDHGAGPEIRHRLAVGVARLIEITGTEPIVDTPPAVPHEAIADIVRRDDVDLVVVGRRGLSGVRALGSVSERVVHTAPCPVLVLPTPPPGA